MEYYQSWLVDAECVKSKNSEKPTEFSQTVLEKKCGNKKIESYLLSYKMNYMNQELNWESIKNRVKTISYMPHSQLPR